ncbi:MAG: adenylate/guanylate cyclase domain-containing protein [Alphaproteobacteria bacterium]|nr:adenylate/guanylate cyclase domain-containing protein [Alphaproteobacteria bacterium]
MALGTVVVPVLADPPTPRPADFADRATIASLVMAGYLALAALTVLATRRDVYRLWMSYAFAAADGALLGLSVALAVHWSIVPASHAFALPIVWLVPILLAIGAMRYEPWLNVLGAGFFVAAMGLVLIFVHGERPDEEILRSRDMSAMFSGPSNLVRLVLVALTGAVLTLAVWRNRRLVRRAIKEARRRAALTRYLAPEIADQAMDAGDALRQGARRKVGMLFVDLRGFTSLSEALDPQAISALLADYRARVTAVVGRFGGIVHEFVGDGVVALFGATETRGDDAARALACALEVAETVTRWGATRTPPLRVAVGAHWGEVYCGAVGDESRLSFAIIGDPMNVAARLEEMCKHLEKRVLASDALVQAAGGAPAGRARLARLDDQPIRGRQQRIAVWALG